jgi:hypothetical protein
VCVGGTINDVYLNTKILGATGYSIITSNNNLSEIGYSNIGYGINIFENVGLSGSNNIAFGDNVLAELTSGDYNIAIGNNALINVTDQSDNIAIGTNTLQSNRASQNIAIGTWSGYYGETGTNNVGVGYLTNYINISGSDNSSFGNGAGYSISNGNKNTAIGSSAFGNTSIGYIISQQPPTESTVVGYQSGMLSQGSQNTFLGAYSGLNDTVHNLGIGSTGNIAIGYQTGNSAIGNNNIFMGYQAGTTGVINSNSNVVIGYQSGNYTNGSYNTFLGYQTGFTGTSLYTGNNLTCIGKNAYPSSTSVSNEITLGNSDITTLRCQATSITSLSDIRDKSDVEVLPLGIDLINQIQPSRFKWNKREWYNDNNVDDTKKEEKWTCGFIAQQLDQVQQTNNAEYLNLVYKSNNERWEATANNLLPVIVKALQDLHTENKELKLKLEQLEEFVKKL